MRVEMNGYMGSAMWLTVLALIFIVIVSGNLLTILAIATNRKLNSVTANKFIYSLATTDLLVGLYIPYHVCFYLYYDILGHELWSCIILCFVPIFSCSHSICKLLTIAADRYVAILYPLHYKRYMTKKIVWGLILGGLLVTILWSTVPIYYHTWDVDLGCYFVDFLPTIYFTYVLTPLFGIVWMTMLLTYIKIWKEARRHTARVKMTTRTANAQHINDSKSFQVVLLTLGCFTFCWMPYFIVTTYLRITDNTSKFSLAYEIAFTLAVCNSGMNPVIYAWKNSNFREAFWCLLTCNSPNNANKNANYITNHVPSSKKSSVANGSDVGHDNVVAQTELDVDEHECSVSTEMTTVNATNWT